MKASRIHFLDRAKTAIRNLACLILFLGGVSPAQALTITPTFTTNFNTYFGANAAAARAAWIAAANVYQTNFNDNIHINITVDATSGTSPFGESNWFLYSTTYSSLRALVVADAATADDRTATGTGGSMTTSDPVGGSHTWWVTRAQAKALGLIADDNSNDGTTTFGAGNPFSFSGTPPSGYYDFQGVCAHEISEVMGRVGLSGGTVGSSANSYSLLDCFSYTGVNARGLGNGGGNFFSFDAGKTLLKVYNDAAVYGLDSRDWGPGTNDSFIEFSNSGVINPVSTVDLQEMDVIGYNRVVLSAPVISSAGTATGTVGQSISYQIVASNSPTSYGATGLPSGLSINTGSGLISGTPTTAGTTNVTLSASNAGGTGTKTLTLTVNPAAAPVISSGGTATGTAGQSFSYQIVASNSPTSYGASGLPSGLSINTSTGLISGAPTIVGTSNVTLSATNAKGTGTKALTLTVNPSAAPVISSAGTATGTAGQSFSYQIVANNSPTSYGATGLPSGLTVNTSTGLILGTPATAGTSNVTLSATNSIGTGTKTLTLTVNPGAAPVISSAGTATGTAGQSFSYQIVASNSPTSYGATGLPSGLGVNTSTGLISGTPTASGTSNVTISATNGSGTGTKALTLTVSPSAVPVISSAGTATGTTGQFFSYQIVASNSPLSYGASGLPSGLSVNTSTGLISGTPTASGASNITLSATNTNGTGTKTLTLTVNPAGGGSTYTLTATSRGWYDQNGYHDPSNTNYLTGNNATPDQYRSFFVFTLPTLAPGETIVSASLQLVNPGGTNSGYQSPDTSENLQINEVTTDISTLTAGTGGTAAFTDLGDGTVFGGRSVSAADNGTTISVPMNAAFLPWAQARPGTSIALGGSLTTLSHYGSNEFVFAFTGANASDTQLVIITTTAVPPVISSAGTATGTAGQSFSYQIVASNSPTSFGATGLPSGLSINTSTGLISGTPTTAGTSNVTLSATNAGGTGTKALSLTVNPAGGGSTYTLTATARGWYDQNGNNTPSNTNYLTGNNSTPDQYRSFFVFTLPTLAAGETIVSATLQLVNPGGTNNGFQSPDASENLQISQVTTAISTLTAGTGGTAAFTDLGDGTVFGGRSVSAADNGTTVLVPMNAAFLPWAQARPGTSIALGGSLTTLSHTGSNEFVFAYTGANASDTQLVIITTIAVPPVISSAGTATGTAGQSFSYQIVASNSPTSYGATGLPPGLSINTSTGLISGTPTTSGSSNVTLSASNAGGTGTKTLTLNVNPAGGGSTYTLTATARGWYDQNGNNTPSNNNYLTGNNSNPDQYRSFFVFTLPTLAPGETIVSANLQLVNPGGTNSGYQSPDASENLQINEVTTAISTLTAGTGGTAAFTDLGDGTVFGGRSVSVADNGTTISVPMNATFLSWAQARPGSSIALGGSLTTLSHYGSNEFVFAYTGGTGGNATDTQLVITTAITVPPVISSAGTATGTVGQSFGYQIVASNSPTSYGASGLPSGLSINTSTGLISGTPTTAGSSNVTLSATNASGTGTKTLTLIVNPAGGGSTYTLTATARGWYDQNGNNTPSNTNYLTGNNSTPDQYRSFFVFTLPTLAPGETIVSANLQLVNPGGANSGFQSPDASENLQINEVTTAISTLTAGTGGTSAFTDLGDGTVFGGRSVSASDNGTTVLVPMNATFLSWAQARTGSGIALGGSLTTLSHTGSNEFVFAYTGANATDTQLVIVTTTAVPPVISSAGTATGTVGQSFSYQIAASNSPTSYGASGLPSGLSINTSTGLISGTPTTTGTSSVTLSATNAGGTGTKALSLTVNPAGGGSTYTLTATARGWYDQNGNNTPSNTNYLTGNNSDPDQYRSFFVFTLPTLAPGETIVSATLQLVNPGGANNGFQSPDASETLQISQVTTAISTLIAGTGGTAAFTDLGDGTVFGGRSVSAADDGTTILLPMNATFLSWAQARPGTSIALGGSLTSLSHPGSNEFVFGYTGSGGATDTQLVIVTTTAVPPVISSAGTATGTVGQSFGYQIVASNSPTSYGASGLPPGLSINTSTGLISGTPTASGTWFGTMSATNAAGTDTESLALTVNLASGGSTYTLVATARGWYDQNGNNTPGNSNYLTGNNSDPDQYRSFFVFTLPTLAAGETIASATLQLVNPGGTNSGYQSPDASENLQISEVTTPTSTLAAGTGGTAAFADLGDGTVFGGRSVSAADNGTTILVPMNATFLSWAAARTGSSIALGGSLTSLSHPGSNEFVFGYSGTNASDTQLVITTTVSQLPTITNQPAGTTIFSGQTATLSVTATGMASLNYQWYQGTSGTTTTPVGTNAPSFTTPALTTTTNYWVKVSNGAGFANSNTATVIIGTPTPQISVQQPIGLALNTGSSTVDFGSASLGGNSSRIFTISNAGTASLTFSAPTIDGANASDFVMTTSPVGPLSPGGSTTFTVLFSPGALNLRSAALHVSSNDPVTNPFDVILTGTGSLASTASATSVSSGWATLNGSANPSGMPTSAYFQYGTSTSYGSVTPTFNLGSGTSAVPVLYNLFGLAKGTTYHYRLVIVSGGVTYYGTDMTFTTSASSPPSWHSGQVTALTNPALNNMADGARTGVADSARVQYWYKGTDNNIWCVYLNSSAWTQVQLSSDGNVSDWLTFGGQYNLLCYAGRDNQIWCVSWNGSQWVTAQLGTVPGGTTIAGDVAIDNAWNTVYFRGTDDLLHCMCWNGKTWVYSTIGTSPTANVQGNLAVDEKNHLVYYQGTDDNLWAYQWTGTQWVQYALTTTANVGGALSVDVLGLTVYYCSSTDNSACCAYWSGKAWVQETLVASANINASATSFSDATPYTSQYNSLYIDGNNQAEVFWFNGSAWTHGVLGDGGSNLTGGLSLQPVYHWVFARRSDGNIILFYYQ